jgi:glycosidase
MGRLTPPIQASPSAHGYDISDYYTVHPRLGTEEDFVALIDAAHAAGIRVIGCAPVPPFLNSLQPPKIVQIGQEF